MSPDIDSIKQNSPLWLEDGNLVLITGHMAFKVHQGVLERNSEIFRDMLSLPQPSNSPEVNGAPVVLMHDEPNDLKYLLLALYDGLYFEQCQASNFSILCGVLRLSIKYIVEHLRVECLKLLQHDWPVTLAGWDLREREAMRGGKYESALTRPHPIFIINLAHELGPAGATLLPAAFYDLSRYNCSHIWTGLSDLPQDRSSNGKSSVKLSATDLQAVMLGKEASQSFIARFLRQELEGREVAVLCEEGPFEDGKGCRGAFEDLAHEVYRGIVGVTCGRDSDPLFTLDAGVVLQRRDKDGGVGAHPASRACEQCRAEFAEAALAARQYVWDQLPCWFGLEEVVYSARVL